MVLSFTCFLILVAVPLNLLGLSGPTGIMFTALNLGQYAFTIGALSLLAFRVVKLRTALASILLMVQSFMVVEMLACSINPTSENVVLVLGDLFLSFGVIVLALAANYKILPFVLVALPASAYISCTALIDNEMFTNFFPLIFMSFLLVPILGYMFVRNFQRLETEHIRMKDTERNVLDALGIDKEKALEFIHTKKKGKINMLDFFLTSSTCHPKFVGKERCNALMTFHEHCFADCLLVLRKVYLYCYDCLCERQHFVDAHPDL